MVNQYLHAGPLRQFGQPPLEKTPFRFLLRESKGSLVGGAGFHRSPQPPAEVRPRRMREVVVSEIALRQNSLDDD